MSSALSSSSFASLTARSSSAFLTFFVSLSAPCPGCSMPCRLMRQPFRLPGLCYLHWCFRPHYLLHRFVTCSGLHHCLSDCRLSDCCRSGLSRRQILHCPCIHFALRSLPVELFLILLIAKLIEIGRAILEHKQLCGYLFTKYLSCDTKSVCPCSP